MVRVDPRTGNISDFLVNRQAAPSSAGNTGGLERPFDVRFDPSGEVLYVVDLGEVQLSREYGLEPFGGTGVVWRITRIRTMVQVPGGRDRAQAPAPREAERVEAGVEAEETVEEAEELTGAEEPTTEAEVSDFEQAELGGFETEEAEVTEAESEAYPEEVAETEASGILRSSRLAGCRERGGNAGGRRGGRH